MAVEQLQMPSARRGEVLVQVVACGVCRSDLHVLQGRTAARLPTVPGHEIAGRVVAVGEGVDAGLAGAEVVASFILPCGTCPRCTGGREEFCERFWSMNRAHGTLYDGETRLFDAAGDEVWMSGASGFAEFAVIPATSVFRVPPSVRLADAATIGCAVFTAYGAVTHAGRLTGGESVVVIATGGVGLNIVQLARAAGAAHIVAVDRGEERLAAARAAGATETVDAGREDVVERCAGADVVFEALGRPETVQQAIAVAATGGRVVLVGLSGGGTATPVVFDAVVRRGLHIVGSYGARARTDMPEILRLVEAGVVRTAASITRRVALDELAATFADMERGVLVGRAVVEM
jgi:S-(hydroxymethyl)glutathione dehydrogenase/alcohol dehydrogenase